MTGKSNALVGGSSALWFECTNVAHNTVGRVDFEVLTNFTNRGWNLFGLNLLPDEGENLLLTCGQFGHAAPLWFKDLNVEL